MFPLTINNHKIIIWVKEKTIHYHKNLLTLGIKYQNTYTEY